MITTKRFLNSALLLLIGLTAFAQPAANFIPDRVTGCPPLIVNLSNTSSGYNASSWDFGNGNTSTQNSPSATYLSPGTFAIKLIVTNASGQKDSITKTVHVFTPPTAQFTTPDTNGCAPLIAHLTDQSVPGEAPITNWAWDFGGPSAQTIPNPTVSYTNAGNWQVTLVVQDGNGCVDNEIKPNYIRTGTPVVASFSANPTSSCTAPQQVDFNNTSTGPVAQTRWYFGDGGTGVGGFTSHTYAAGNYTAKLVITSTLGCKDSTTTPINIATLPVSFTASDTVICAGVPVSFTDLSAAANGWSWNFGVAGGTSTQQNPTFTYTNAGTYTVSLTTTGTNCTGILTKTNYITVLSSPPASFTTPDTASCKAPLTSNFTSSTSGATSYDWDFGDGQTATSANTSHTFTQNGFTTVEEQPEA